MDLTSNKKLSHSWLDVGRVQFYPEAWDTSHQAITFEVKLNDLYNLHNNYATLV